MQSLLSRTIKSHASPLRTASRGLPRLAVPPSRAHAPGWSHDSSSTSAGFTLFACKQKNFTAVPWDREDDSMTTRKTVNTGREDGRVTIPMRHLGVAPIVTGEKWAAAHLGSRIREGALCTRVARWVVLAELGGARPNVASGLGSVRTRPPLIQCPGLAGRMWDLATAWQPCSVQGAANKSG